MVLIGSQLKAWREFQVAKSNLTNAWGKDQKKNGIAVSRRKSLEIGRRKPKNSKPREDNVWWQAWQAYKTESESITPKKKH